MSVASQVYEGWHRRRRRKEVAAAVPSVTIIESPDFSSSSNIMGNENKSSMLEEDCTEIIICSTTSSPAVANALSNNRPLPTRIEEYTRGSKKCISRLSKPIRNCWIVLIAICLICNNSSCYAFQSTNNNYGRIYNNIATTNQHRRMVS